METLKNGFHYPVTVILTSDEQFGYAREPIIQRMPDGSIVCLTLTGGPTEPHKTNVVGVVRSEDDGKSWSRHTTLFQHSERACWAPRCMWKVMLYVCWYIPIILNAGTES